MKKLFFILMLMALPVISNSQPLFGYGPADIRQKIPNVEWNYGKWGSDKECLTMNYISDNMSVIYFFDKNNLSVITTIYPTTQGMLQGIIETYNKRYVIVDSYNWKFYDSGVLYKCSLKQTDDNGYFFLWTVE